MKEEYLAEIVNEMRVLNNLLGAYLTYAAESALAGVDLTTAVQSDMSPTIISNRVETVRLTAQRLNDKVREATR